MRLGSAQNDWVEIGFVNYMPDYVNNASTTKKAIVFMEWGSLQPFQVNSWYSPSFLNYNGPAWFRVTHVPGTTGKFRAYYDLNVNDNVSPSAWTLASTSWVFPGEDYGYAESESAIHPGYFTDGTTNGSMFFGSLTYKSNDAYTLEPGFWHPWWGVTCYQDNETFYEPTYNAQSTDYVQVGPGAGACVGTQGL